jgi:hypothetical protein
MSTPDKPTSQTPSNPELIAAWQWFINYDESSETAQTEAYPHPHGNYLD